MKTLLKCSAVLLVLLFQISCPAQNLDLQQIAKPTPGSWPTYSGDYSGRRYSPLTEVNQSNVKHLSLAWTAKLNSGPQSSPGNAPVTIAGVGTETNGPLSSFYNGIRGNVLEVDGVLYMGSPDNAWAIDARDGHELWHFFWKTKGGAHTSNKGLAMWKGNIYIEEPDDYLVCLDARTGKEKWHKEVASFDKQYFLSVAPIVAGDHIIVGESNDLDEPGFIQSFNPETGDREWIFYNVPMKNGDIGIESWPNVDAASHGGGSVWVPGSYDPETHLYIYGTGNPTAAYTPQTRGKGDNLFTCTLIAVNVDTGKLAWYYQNSPNDVHDFDASETPVLIDGVFAGKQRKLLLSAARNGYFFVLDRVTGEHLLTSKLSDKVNWSLPELNKNGAPVHDPIKDNSFGGVLVNASVTNFWPRAYSPDTGLLYVPVTENYHLVYLTTKDPRGAMGLGGIQELNVANFGNYIAAVDYKTGKTVWRHRYDGNGGSPITGFLATAGKLLFGGDMNGNFAAYSVVDGTPLWHSRINPTSWPMTYSLDGKQYIFEASAETLYAFSLND